MRTQVVHKDRKKEVLDFSTHLYCPSVGAVTKCFSQAHRDGVLADPYIVSDIGFNYNGKDVKILFKNPMRKGDEPGFDGFHVLTRAKNMHGSPAGLLHAISLADKLGAWRALHKMALIFTGTILGGTFNSGQAFPCLVERDGRRVLRLVNLRYEWRQSILVVRLG